MSDYKDITKEEIEKGIKELFYKKTIDRNRKTKLYVLFNTQEQANAWIEKVWKPLILKAIEDETGS